jgi:uncharacterized protein (DUF488 family)
VLHRLYSILAEEGEFTKHGSCGFIMRIAPFPDQPMQTIINRTPFAGLCGPNWDTNTMLLFTVGYGYWPPARRISAMIDVLRAANVKVLVDTRHSPCASQPYSTGIYGPRAWHLQAGGTGIESELRNAGIEYRWLMELGNPQKNDPRMTILRAQLESADLRWPVNRGLLLLKELFLSNSCLVALMCACAQADRCHRTLVAEAAAQRFPELHIDVRHLPSADFSEATR